MPISIIVQAILGQSMSLKDARMTAHQTGTPTPIVLDTIVSSDRYDSEAQPNTYVESAKDDPEGESVRRDVVLERRAEEI